MHYVRLMLLAFVVALAPTSGGAYILGGATSPVVNAPNEPEVAASNSPATLVRTDDKSGPASPQVATGQVLTDSVGILIRLFVLAVILESALAVIFHWRPYLARFDGKAVNPLLTFLAAFVLVEAFHLDEVGLLIGRYATDPGTALPTVGDLRSVIVTALVIAGGSAGVNKMLQALGYRSIALTEDQPKPPRNEAWIAVIDASRAASAGEYDVMIKKGAADWSVLGSIARGGSRSALFGWMLRDRRRFPPSGGFSVPIDTMIEVGVKARDPGSESVAIWGPSKVEPGAIVNIQSSRPWSICAVPTS
jgi:hypothetical protein